ncbi:MAG: ribbon-helix-helix domain-containing protein [Coriobacteriia bacterium]|nr:ribbon-helix-helix domain-containing protein [Coriobacteriia bacterium]
MTTVTLRLPEEDAELIKSYAAQERRTVSDVIRLAILEKIEDEYDLKLYKQAMAEFEKDPTTYTLAEIKEMHGLK